MHLLDGQVSSSWWNAIAPFTKELPITIHWHPLCSKCSILPVLMMVQHEQGYFGHVCAAVNIF